jgi:hypothetical protein
MSNGNTFAELKRPGCEADNSLPASCRGQENVNLYSYLSIRLHGVVFKFLSIGTTLRFTFSSKYNNTCVEGVMFIILRDFGPL